MTRRRRTRECPIKGVTDLARHASEGVWREGQAVTDMIETVRVAEEHLKAGVDA
jgi:hypothetical protein